MGLFIGLDSKPINNPIFYSAYTKRIFYKILLLSTINALVLTVYVPPFASL